MATEHDLRWALAAGVADLDPDVDRELDRVLGRATRRTWTRRAGGVAGLVAAVVLTALAAGQDWRSDARAPEPADNAPVRAVPLLLNRGMYEDPATLEPNRYEVSFLPETRAFLVAHIDVPAGWGQDDIYSLATGPAGADTTRRIDLVSRVLRVQREACVAGSFQPGPTTYDLAQALASVRGFATSTPRPVTVAGHSGWFVRVHVPTSAARGGCGGREDRHLYGWAGCGETWAGWTRLLWALDVEGHRVLVDASYGPRATDDQVTELVRMVESATYTTS